jgi:hypothetical protein
MFSKLMNPITTMVMLTCSFQITFPLVQTLPGTRRGPIDKAVNIRVGNAGIPCTYLLYPKGTVYDWSSPAQSYRRAENDRTIVQITDGREPDWRYSW